MTREEAIDYLLDPIGKREKHDEAVSMAIKALERPPVITCGECEHWKHNDNFVQGKCKVTKLHPKRGWFCGSGEPRREGEQ